MKLLASQAATALENTRLYGDLAEREAKIRRLVDANIIGIFTWHIPRHGPEEDEGFFLEVNDAFLRMLGYEREDFVSGRLRRTDLTPPEWRERDIKTIAELREFWRFATVREGVLGEGWQACACVDGRRYVSMKRELTVLRSLSI